MIYEKDDYDEEIKAIKDAGRFLASRRDLRIALLTDKKLIKKFKKENSTFFESTESFTSLIVKRYDSKIFVQDLIHEGLKDIQFIYNTPF